MNKILPALAIVAAVAVPAFAQHAPAKDPAKVESGAYAVDPNHTQVMFKVSHMGFTAYHGDFNDVSGTLNLEPKSPEKSSLDVKVATASVLTKSAKLTDELKGDQWLDAAKYPDITFKSSKVVKTGAETAKVTGDLTLHGVTQPVTLDARFIAAGTNPLSKAYTAGFEISGKIKRSDFGVKTYVPMIGDEVDLVISGAFEKQG